MFKKITALPNIQKAGALIFLILITASIIVMILKKMKPDKNWDELTSRIRSWWIMASFFLLAMLVSKNISLLFFAFLSFWALKEYITILNSRRADHRAIFWAFLIIPVQYYWAFIGWYGMFIIFIPVFMFLFLPMRLVLAKETSGFLISVSKIQWGIMAFIFCLSHLGYLLQMRLR